LSGREVRGVVHVEEELEKATERVSMRLGI
jgi:hypothetical protein